MKFQDIPQMSRSHYNVNVPWKYFREGHLDKARCGVYLDLNPPFQRAYVWTEKQKTEYIEWILKGGESGRNIYLNHPGWMGSFKGDFVIVDGKQRVDAALGFLDNEVQAFGLYYKDFEGWTDNMEFNVHINNLKTEKEILKWYLDMNSCGTAHTDADLDKVREMLKNVGG